LATEENTEATISVDHGGDHAGGDDHGGDHGASVTEVMTTM
jgi:hypothetical protein